MKELINRFPDISIEIIEYFVANKSFLFEILFSSQESTGQAFKNLILNVILINYKINLETIEADNGTIPKVIELLDYLINLLPNDVSKTWLKMINYLELLESLSENDMMLPYLFKNELIYRLIDFFLMKDSPLYKKGDNRAEFGSKTVPPKFAPLLSCLANLVRHCYTDTFSETDLEQGNMPNGIIMPVFKPSERDLECLYNRSFYKKAIKETFNNPAISKILAHLMWNNIEFSKKRVFMVLEVVNDGLSLTDARSAFELLFNIMGVEDRFTQIRMEWIFGIPQIVVKTDNTPILPVRSAKYGDKIYKYISPLLYGTYNDSLIERLITKYQASSDFIVILNFFFSIIYYKPHIFTYFDSLPHPKKDKAFLFEHICSLANEEINRIFNITSMQGKYENAIKGMTKIMNGHHNDKKLEMTKEPIPKFKPNYTYGAIIREHINHFENPDINNMNLFSFSIAYDVEILGEINEFENDIDTSLSIKKSVTENNEEESTNTPSKHDEEQGNQSEIEKQSSHQKSPHELVGLFNNETQTILNNNEESFFRRNFAVLLEKELCTRSFYTTSNHLVVNCIRRYVFFNNSDNDYKVRYTFINNDDFTNCYIPAGEVVIIARKHSVSNVFTYVKDDINLPWNDIQFIVESEIYNSPSSNENRFEEEKQFKKSKSHDDLAVNLAGSSNDLPQLPAADDNFENNVQGDEDYFPLDCMKCGFSNMIKCNSPDYTCQKCKKEIF